MNDINYFTVADARASDPEKFDQAIKTALHQAADDIGTKATISALCSKDETASQPLVKAA